MKTSNTVERRTRRQVEGTTENVFLPAGVTGTPRWCQVDLFMTHVVFNTYFCKPLCSGALFLFRTMLIGAGLRRSRTHTVTIRYEYKATKGRRVSLVGLHMSALAVETVCQRQGLRINIGKTSTFTTFTD